jgi:uncharacterized protein
MTSTEQRDPELSVEPTAVVQRMFAAFEKGDLDALVKTVHVDSQWTYYGADPGLAHADFNGVAAVRRFFEGIIRRVAMSTFEPREFIVQGDTVIVFGREAGTRRTSGQSFSNEWVQKYVVRDAQIVSMVEYNIQVAPPADHER